MTYIKQVGERTIILNESLSLVQEFSEWGYVSLNELAEIPFIVPFIQNDTKIDMSGHVYK